jgi:23S rRNA (cytosine1962-C5)-methyltransferase
VQSFSRGCRVLNLFGYTGGFSVYAGLAGASAVTTVDVADAALAAADANWALNGLKASKHEAVTMDAFEFLERAHSGICRYWVGFCTTWVSALYSYYG